MQSGGRVFALQNIQRMRNHDSTLRNFLSLPISGSTGLHQLPAGPHISRTDMVYEGPESHSKQGSTQLH